MELIAGASLAEILARVAARKLDELSGADLLQQVCELSGADFAGADRAALPFALGWVDACAWIAREVAQALEHAHQRGVVHRDVKPSNILLTPSGRVMLVDFGLASTEGADALTRSGSAVGSLPYMSPEQVRGEAQELGVGSDVYGLGVTLYEMLALRRPFDGDDSLALRTAILDARPRPVRALHARVPRDLEVVVGVAMAPEVARRYPSAADLARDLTHVLRREPIEARKAGAGVQLARWTQRHPALAALAALFVVGPSLFAWQQWSAGVKIAAARDRADANFDQALDAVDTMLTRVGESTLEYVPQAEEVRRELLEDALTFYGRFLDQSGGTRGVRLREAITRGKVARLRRDLGRAIEADEAYAGAESTLRALELDGTPPPELRHELMKVLQDRAQLLQGLACTNEAELLDRELLERCDAAMREHGRERWLVEIDAKTSLHLAALLRSTYRYVEGVPLAERSIANWRELVERDPTDVDALRNLGQALATTAQLATNAWKAERVWDAYVEGVEWLRSAHETDPEHPLVRDELAMALANSGRFRSQARFDDGYEPVGPSAQELLVESLELYAGLTADYPKMARYQASCAGASTNLCIDLARTGQLARARPYGEQAARAYESLCALEPQVPKHKADLGAALNNLARLQMLGGDPAGALVVLERALERMQSAMKSDPNNLGFRVNYENLNATRFDTLAKLGRWRDGVELARELDGAQRFQGTAVVAAELLVRGSLLAAKDEALDQLERERERDALVTEALEWVRTAIELGSERSKLAVRPGYAPLRADPRFLELTGG
jgi:tetratricopeptide (TPR) repeat protein